LGYRLLPYRPGFTIFYLPTVHPGFSFFTRFFLTPSLLWLFRSRQPSVDAVIIHELRSLQTVWGAVWAGKRRIPVILLPHGAAGYNNQRQLIKQCFDRLFLGTIIRYTSRFIAISDHEREDLININVSPAVTHRMPNGIAPESIAAMIPVRPFRKKERYRVGFLGRLHPSKNLDHILLAVHASQTTCCDIHFAGPDEGMQSRLSALAQQLGLTEQVFFHGFLDGEAKTSFLDGLDLFVSPSTNEGFPASPLEAIMCGTPVVLANAYSLAQTLQQEGAAMLIPPHNYRDLGRIIHHLDNHLTDGPKQVRAGQRYIRQHLDGDRVATRYIDLIKELKAKNDTIAPVSP